MSTLLYYTPPNLKPIHTIIAQPSERNQAIKDHAQRRAAQRYVEVRERNATVQDKRMSKSRLLAAVWRSLAG